MTRLMKIGFSLLAGALLAASLSACSTSSQDKFADDYSSFSRQQDKDWDRFFHAVMQ